jgi:hypothetical protein
MFFNLIKTTLCAEHTLVIHFDSTFAFPTLLFPPTHHRLSLSIAYTITEHNTNPTTTGHHLKNMKMIAVKKSMKNSGNHFTSPFSLILL